MNTSYLNQPFKVTPRPKCELCEDAGYTHELCTHCNGSGEGSYDGSRCPVCGGWGQMSVKCSCKEEKIKWK